MIKGKKDTDFLSHFFTCKVPVNYVNKNFILKNRQIIYSPFYISNNKILDFRIFLSYYSRVIAKKTLLKTAMKAGFKPKPSSRKQKYVIQGPHDSRTLPSPGRTPPSIGFDIESDRPSSLYEDDLSSESESIQMF